MKLKTSLRPRRLRVVASKRALKMLADQAIGHDLVKGLIELITNSDESYARLEAKQIPVSGRIEIEVDRRPRKKLTVLRVIDWAEGMDEERLETCVGRYGEDTSGQMGRGVFGMGLKDTINAFGVGTITSFKDGKKYRGELKDIENLEIYPALAATAADRKEFRNADGGTNIEIVVKNPKVKIPFVDSLRQQIQTHVCLRGIMTDRTRKVTVRDLRSGSADELHYVPPDGETLLDGFPLDLPNHPEIQALLTVKHAVGTDSLAQSTSYRTGGILVTSRRTCHESTLFGFDEDPHAARLFGELRCDQIYDLQAAGDPIVDKNRNGLRKDHPLTKDLWDARRREVEKIIAEEKLREQKKRQRLEKEETLRRFTVTIRNLNDIAQRELQMGGAGHGKERGLPHPPILPKDGFEFIPDTYRLLLAERETLKLRVQVDGTTGVAVGERIEVTCDNPNIRILDTAPVVPKLFSEDPPLSIVQIPVEGIQANAQGFVTAKFNGASAIAAVEVVSTKTQKHHQPSGGGLFKEIRYEERPDLPLRARFDRKEGIIWINTLGPSVDLYFGPDGEGQELPANQLLVAELVSELSCQEIARVKRETKTLDVPPGVDELDAFFTHLNRLKADYAPLIHRSLVDAQIRRA